MPDGLKQRFSQLPARLLEMWNKYTKKQKTIILSVVGAVIAAIIILVIVMGRIEYTPLTAFKDTKTAKQAVDIMSENNIAYKLAEDDVTVLVDASKRSEAVMLIAESEISSADDFDWQDLLDTGMGTTNYDKKTRKDIYSMKTIEKILEAMDGIDKATVTYYSTDNTYSILESDKNIACTVFLVTNSLFRKEKAEGIAAIVASAIGNTNTDNIKIMDQSSTLLYNGPRDEDEFYRTQNIEIKDAIYETMEKRVVQLGLANMFSDVSVMLNLDINLDQVSEVFTDYLAPEGQDQPLIVSSKTVSSENTGTSGDVPGTDSNDENDYMLETSQSGNSSYDSEEIQRIPNEHVTRTMRDTTAINKETSSMALVLKRVITRNENDLKLAGLLEGTTYEEYIVNNSQPTEITLPDEYRVAFSNATGIPQENITLTAYQVYSYEPSEETGTNWDLYLKIILSALIVAMLLFVVFRGMAPVEVTEVEPELSVEQLLATTKENQSLDDIEFSDRSEVRVMIEKFVEENPEAVANLLRNWLNDDGWE